jgi:hypothetical protein
LIGAAHFISFEEAKPFHLRNILFRKRLGSFKWQAKHGNTLHSIRFSNQTLDEFFQGHFSLRATITIHQQPEERERDRESQS